jgi:hypothetical protein
LSACSITFENCAPPRNVEVPPNLVIRFFKSARKVPRSLGIIVVVAQEYDGQRFSPPSAPGNSIMATNNRAAALPNGRRISAFQPKLTGAERVPPTHHLGNHLWERNGQ